MEIKRNTMYAKYFKRVLDFLLSLIAIIILSPVLLIIAIAIKIDSKGPVFFLQERLGKDGKVFKIIKFRTMVKDAEKMGTGIKTTEKDSRITKVGSFLRKTSLDEIPQLINVLKGDMALIGPRPLLPQYLPLYSKEQARRHEVRPGITGWAQVNGRNAISWNKKFELDVWYVDHCSFGLDLKIIFLTIKKVFIREGISQEGQATIEPFNGHN